MSNNEDPAKIITQKICPLFAAAWARDNEGQPLPMLCLEENCMWMTYDEDGQPMHCAVKLLAEATNDRV